MPSILTSTGGRLTWLAKEGFTANVNIKGEVISKENNFNNIDETYDGGMRLDRSGFTWEIT